jgi:diacylglycerol kinase family enzyme
VASGPVGLISNPASGHNRDQFRKLRSRIDRSNIHHLVTAGRSDIPTALATLRDAGIRTLAINGGDGTNSAILGEMLEGNYFPRPPAVVLLPGGTANMNAGDVGMRGSLAASVSRFCDWCDGDRRLEAPPKKRHLLRVSHDGALHHCMFLGAGAVINGTEYAHREIHARGLRDDFSLALGTIRTVWGVVRGHPEFLGHQRIGLSLGDGEQRDHDTLILAISTLERLAFGMRPFWGNEPGTLRLTLMEQGCTRFARTFATIARGKPSRNAVPEQGYFSHNANQIRLFMEGKVNLDGEILEVAGELDISTTAALEFLQP